MGRWPRTDGTSPQWLSVRGRPRTRFAATATKTAFADHRLSHLAAKRNPSNATGSHRDHRGLGSALRRDRAGHPPPGAAISIEIEGTTSIEIAEAGGTVIGRTRFDHCACTATPVHLPFG
ncbi:hypothetical protein [Saccharopolyspora shandongensis]|uniref:hypothetical protein n=1 Tax=Saccharopolyspora shandongensis TaxID=418495 RepID=UPI00340DE457